jgi:signal transduction histidine kinase
MNDSDGAPQDTDVLRTPIRLLIIDDDMVDRQIYLRFLQTDERNTYVVTEAASAEEGIRLIRDQIYDCILLDYRLPASDGLAMYRTLTGTERGPSIAPVIMMTGQGNESVAVAAMKSGISDYLTKEGLTPKAMQRAITNAVDRLRLRRSLSEKNRHLAETNAELKRRTAELERVYHSVSHELKTPLTAVREFVALVLDGVAGPAPTMGQRSFLEHAIDGCDQMNHHLNDLIDSSRLDTGKLQLKLLPTRANRVIEFALASIRAVARAKNVTLKSHVSTEIPLVLADPLRLGQILGNLLSNAAKFTEPGGTIVLRAGPAAERADEVEFEISDNGCGIAPEHIPQIFDRLFQVSLAGDELMGSGLGLGLSIARHLVILHGGRLTVESTLGAGSVFRFRVPAAPAAAPAAQDPTGGQPPAVTGGGSTMTR